MLRPTMQPDRFLLSTSADRLSNRSRSTQGRYTSGIPPESHSNPTGYTTEQWQGLWEPFGPDLLLLNQLDHLIINHTNLSIEDGLRAFYYQFSIALKYRGVSLLDDTLRDDNDHEEYHCTLDLAARQVAADALQADPHDQLAQRIRTERIGAPLSTHADFFDHIWERIALFLQTHPTA
jgi:hypothetical protein